MSGSPSSSSSGLRSPPPPPSAPPPPPRAPSQIQDTHKAAGRPRRAQHSRRAARAQRRRRRPTRAGPRPPPLPPPPPPPPAPRGGSGSLKVKAEARGAPWSSPRAGGAWRARGAGPRVCKLRARARRGQARWRRPSPSVASRVRLVRSLLLGFFSFFFFFFSPLLVTFPSLTASVRYPYGHQ